MLKLVAISALFVTSQAFLFPPAPAGGGGCCAPAAPACAPPACAPQISSGCSPCGGSSYGGSSYGSGSSYGGSSYGSSSYGGGYAAPQQSYSSGGGYAVAAPQASQAIVAPAQVGGSYASVGQIGGQAGGYSSGAQIGSGQGGYANGPQIGGQSAGGYSQVGTSNGQAGSYSQGPSAQIQGGGQGGYQQGPSAVQGGEQSQGGSYQQQQPSAPVSAPESSQGGYQEGQQVAASTAAPAVTSSQAPSEEHAYEDIGSDHAEHTETEHAESSSRGYKALAAPTNTEETNSKCNSEALKKIILDNIHEKPAVAKRQIQKVASEELGPKFDVICSVNIFSYLVNTEIFCEVEGKGVTCLAYRQVTE